MKKDWISIFNAVRKLKELTTLGVANIAGTGISAIFWFYVASIVGTESYGEISYFIAIAGIVSVVSFLGAGNTIIVYTAKDVKIQPALYFITLVSGFLSSILLYFVFENIGVSVYVLGYILFNLAISEILGKKLYGIFSKYLITQKIIMVILGIGLYFLMGLQGVILGIALAFFPYTFVIYKGFKFQRISFSLLKERIGFVINSYVLDLSRTFSGQTDKLIIGPLFGFTLLGNYQLGIQFLSLLTLLPSIVYQYILPRDSSGFSNRLLKKGTILFSVAISLLGFFLGPIVLPVFFPKFVEAVDILRIVSFAIIPLTINLMYISKFLGNEKSRIVLIGSGIYLTVQIAAIMILGNILGINGIAIALVLAASSEALYLVVMDFFIKKDESGEINTTKNKKQNT